MNDLPIYPALMDRLTRNEKIVDGIINNEFILDTRLKVRMYLAVKHNNNALMHYYNNNHYLLGGDHDTVSLSVNDVEFLAGLPFPFKMEDRAFDYSPQDHKIKISVRNVVICTIDLNERLAVIVKKGTDHDDIHFMIRNVPFLKTVLLYKGDSTKKRKGCDHGHRRPKIRRRHDVG